MREDSTMRLSAVRLIVFCTLGFLAMPFVAVTQPLRNVPRLGMLLPSRAVDEPSPYTEAFRQGLREFGWVEGQNILLEYRHAERQLERFPALAAELVHLPVDVLFASTSQGAQAAKQVTTTIPVVFEGLSDPVAFGLVESLERPGGNLTGVCGFAPEVSGKQLEMLTEIRPGIRQVAVLVNPASPSVSSILQETERAARALGVQLRRVDVRDAEALEGAFTAMTSAPAEAFLVLPDSLLLSQRGRIVEFAAQYRLPVTAEVRAFAEAGGLLTYGTSLLAQWRRAAYYVDRILKGTKPADLPVEQPMKFELVINLKTAQGLGLTIPPALLMLADEVIR
jgi:putative ABC transport system substrate-binding protein